MLTMNMLTNFITSCCSTATLGLIVGMLAATPAIGSESPRVLAAARTANAYFTRNRELPVAPPDAPPSPDVTMRAYQTLDGWVRAWNVPDAAPDLSNQAAVAPDGAGTLPTAPPTCGGVSIVLRLVGEIIGRGTVTNDAAPGTNPETLGVLLQRAARIAIQEADRRIRIDNDVLRDDRIRLTAREITVSLELAGMLIPIEPESFDDLERDLIPGIDGTAVRIGEELAVTFPGTLLSTNTPLRLAFSKVASQAGGDVTLGLDEPKKLRTQHAARYYRFRTTHLAQTAPTAGPVFLVRGSRFVDATRISTAELRLMAYRLTTHLLSREWNEPGEYGMRGLYEAWSGQYSPAFAGAVDQLTAAFALRNYAAAPGVDPQRAIDARSLAGRIIRAIGKVEPDESPINENPVACALFVITESLNPRPGETTSLTPPPAPPNSNPLYSDARRTVLASYNSLTGFTDTVPLAARGVVAYALVELAAVEPVGGLRDEAVSLAESAVRRAYRDSPEGLLISQMPWLGFAERRLANIKPAAAATSDLPAAVSLRLMRSDLWKHQIAPTDTVASEVQGGSPDLIGGIVFTGVLANRGGSSSAAPGNATWQSAQALAFIPAMLTDARLTPAEERPLELARLIASLRFIRQLQIDESAMWMIPVPSRALGGIRATLWDARLPSDATSMSLLAVAETLRAIDAMSRGK